MKLLHARCGRPLTIAADLPGESFTADWDTVLVCCTHCEGAQTSGHPAGGPTRADALVGSGSSTVAGTTRGAEEPWEGSADGFDRVKQSTGHRRPAEAGVR